jgi:hypothetical protein
VQRSFKFFSDVFEHALAWSAEAARRPESVRLFDMNRLGSLDRREVKEEFQKIADFLEIPREHATSLVEAAFRPPDLADDAIVQEFGIDHDSVNSGVLVEPTGKNLYMFEAAASSLASEVRELWYNSIKTWISSPDSKLRDMAEVSLKGVNSTPPLSLTLPLKGDTLHAMGKCRPCVFALRDVCRNTAEACMYCHAEGHAKPKRASHKVRRQKKAMRDRGRTPSPSPSPYHARGSEHDGFFSLPTVVLPPMPVQHSYMLQRQDAFVVVNVPVATGVLVH